MVSYPRAPMGRAQGAAIFQESQSLIDRAKALVEIAVAACETSRSGRATRATARRPNPKHTARLLKDLDTAARDLEMLKARLDAAAEDARRPRRKQR